MSLFLLIFYGTVFVIMGGIAVLWIVRMTKSAFGRGEPGENADE